MALVSMKCPECGASLEMDDSMEFGTCEFCGTKVAVEHSENTVDDSVEKPAETVPKQKYRCEMVRLKGRNDTRAKFYVTIDGLELGLLSQGSKKPMRLSEGTHTMVIQLRGFNDFSATFNIDSETRLVTGLQGAWRRQIYLRSEPLEPVQEKVQEEESKE
ncbi:MAG: hypothetical protein E7Z64_06710 [Thermoplasmata archaeon]|nr:hypothetical protein [Thermoplasmata archaeon]